MILIVQFNSFLRQSHFYRYSVREFRTLAKLNHNMLNFMLLEEMHICKQDNTKEHSSISQLLLDSRRTMQTITELGEIVFFNWEK